MYNDDERRRNERAWNDPPMFSYDQLNKQPSSAIPLNKRYKYPVVDQQALNNQMYQAQAGYMQNNSYVQAGAYQQPYSQYTPNQAATLAAYNQQQQAAMMNAAMSNQYGQPNLQQAANYAYNQQYAAQSPYQSSLPQAPISSAYSTAGTQAAVSQSMASNQLANQLNYQTAANQQQTSAYLPNTINPSISSQIPVSNQSMMQTTAGGYSMTGAGQQYNQYNQQMYAQQQQQMQQQYPNTPNQYGQPQNY